VPSRKKSYDYCFGSKSVSIPSSGGSAFTRCLKSPCCSRRYWFQSPLLGAVPSPFFLNELDIKVCESFNPLFWGQCLHRGRDCLSQVWRLFQSPLLGAVPSPRIKPVVQSRRNPKVSIPSSGGSAFTPRIGVLGAEPRVFQSPLLGAVPSHENGVCNFRRRLRVSIPSSGGSAFTREGHGKPAAIHVSIPSSGGSAFTALGGAGRSVVVFQSPLLGAVPSPNKYTGAHEKIMTVSIPSSGGSAFTLRARGKSQGGAVSIPSSGGSAFTVRQVFRDFPARVFQSPLLGAVPSP